MLSDSTLMFASHAHRLSLCLVLAASPFAHNALAEQAGSDYACSAEVRKELVRVLSCEADRDAFMRIGTALSDLHYGAPAAPAFDGWKEVGDAGFVIEFAMPESIEVQGQTVSSVMAAGEGLLAVLEGDQVEPLSKALGVAAGDDAFTRHIRTRLVRSEDLGDGMRIDIVQTVSAITTHPGKTLVGCEYRLVY